jgi:hypothetical protein
MPIALRKCVECGEEFELKPSKPGYSNTCPACSPSVPLLPTEAREAALARKSQNADALFRNEIADKRKAERSRNWDEADKIESEIQRLDKARIKIPSRAKP